jgi:hypothetical protein
MAPIVIIAGIWYDGDSVVLEPTVDVVRGCRFVLVVGRQGITEPAKEKVVDAIPD